MKKITAILITLLAAFSLMACGFSPLDINFKIEKYEPNYQSLSFVITWDTETDIILKDSMYMNLSLDGKVVSSKVGIKSGEAFEVTRLKENTTYLVEVFATSGKNLVTLYREHKTTLVDGSSVDNPYLISNKQDLMTLYETMQKEQTEEESGNIEYRKDVLLKTYYKLAADIDMENEVLMTSIFNGKEFKGTFDGNGKTIRNVEVLNTDKGEVSLFGRVSGTIKNLTVENVYINSKNNSYAGTSYVSIIAHNAFNTNVIFEGIHIKDSKIEYTHYSTVGTLYLGAVAGNAKGKFKDITIDCLDIDLDITRNLSTAYVGSLVGRYNDESNKKINRIQNVMVTNNTTNVNFVHVEESGKNRTLNVGGIIGGLSISGTQSNLYYQGEININQTKFENKLTETQVSSNSEVNVGGIVGKSGSEISQVYADVNINIQNTENNEKNNLKGIKFTKAGILAGRNQYVLKSAIGKGNIHVLTDSQEADTFIGYVDKMSKPELYAGYQSIVFNKNNVVIEDVSTITIYANKEELTAFLENQSISQWIKDRL
ncbi:MAG: hypothetical protein GX312_01705 [Candidatus Phytoplasma sp.]|nr:hypothetical protein [Phytoplasma sp.]